jgi:hypothetical protein
MFLCLMLNVDKQWDMFMCNDEWVEIFSCELNMFLFFYDKIADNCDFVVESSLTIAC